MKKAALILFISVFLLQNLFPQTSPITFGAVSRSDLEMQVYPQEKGAEAVVLCDYATSKIIYNDGFKVEFTRHVRIKILKPAGYELANIQIPYTRNDKLSGLEAVTHNLENDIPVSVTLIRKQIYLERANPYRYVTRFTFPQVREGSIIEYTYTLEQDEVQAFRPFTFQWTIPVRHVEYWASLPEYFTYNVNFHGNNVVRQESTTQTGYLDAHPVPLHIYRWVGDMVPAFQEEPKMPQSDAYYSGVSFTLIKIDFPEGRYKELSYTYDKLSDELLNFSDLGRGLNNALPFSKIVEKLTIHETTPMGKMEAIYGYVQNTMKWNGYDELIPEVTLQKAHRDKTGNSAEINLLLVNMLRTAGITADPVVLSTRENGPINTVVAMISKLDYTICLAEINGKEFLLDATDKYRPLGILPFKCLNVEGWVLNVTRGRWIKLLKEENFVTQEVYNLKLSEQGELKGHALVTFTGYDAVNMRKLINDEGEPGLREKHFSLSEGNLVVSNLRIQALDSLQLPLKVSFDVEIRHAVQSLKEMVFFKPLMSIFGDFSSPWVKGERIFPIDFGCPSHEYFNCIISLPENYLPDELPKNVRLILPDDDAIFVFGATTGKNSLVITGELGVNKSWIETKEYPSFREFYTQVCKKTSEVVILKKINNI